MTDENKFKKNGYTVRIIQEEDAQTPENGNNDLFLITTSNRHFEVTRKEFQIEHVQEYKKKYHILPLYAYVHSGVALSLGGFSDPWDSGQIGFVLVQKGAGFRSIEKVAEGYVEEWNQYLTERWWISVGISTGSSTARKRP